MHKLLERQIRRILGDRSRVPEDFLDVIDAAYAQADEDRRLLERAMELTSEELLERNDDLSRSLALLQATLEATAEGILVVSCGGRIEIYNQCFVTLFDHPPEILERRDGNDSFEHAASQVADPTAFRDRLAEIHSQPEHEAFDEIEMKDGRLIERFTRPMLRKGEIRGRVWSFRDITEKRQLEEQIRQSQKMEAIGRLAGGIAHDFNNLLTVITGSCDLGRRRVDSDSALSKLLDEIMAAAHRAGDMTAQLLSFSRRDVVDAKALVVDEVIRDMEDMLQRLIREDIALTTRLEAGGARVLADRGRFNQVVLNLVINASDALRQGGEIEIATAVIDGPLPGTPRPSSPIEKSHLLLTVRDNGPGIPPEIQQRIFEPFFTTKPVGQGTGLGLATVYGIVGQFGGKLDLDSAPECGSEFRVALPLTDRVTRRCARAAVRRLARPSIILAVEDDPAVRLILTRMLGLLDGCETHVAASPAEALERFAGDRMSRSLDLLISDIVMPDMDGFELAKALQEHYPDLRVLFVSGYDPTTASAHGSITEDPHVAFLGKPFDWKTLESTIHEVLMTGEAFRPVRRERESG